MKLALTEDEGIFGTVAQEMGNGARLYTDVWDHKPPLIYIEYEILYKTFGITEVPVHVAVVLCHWICALLIFFLIKRLGFGDTEAFAAAFLYPVLVSPPWFQSWTGRSDLTMQPWLLGAFILIQTKRSWSAFAAGVLWAAAFFTKQTALIYLPLFFFFSSKPRLETVVEFLGGADLVAAIIAAPFYCSGRMDDFWGAVWGVNTLYISSGWQTSLANSSRFMAKLNWELKIMTNLAGFFAAACYAAVDAARETVAKAVLRPYSFMVLWLILALLGCGLSGRLANYYFVALIAPLAGLGGIVGTQIKGRTLRLGFLLLAVAPPLYAYWSVFETRPDALGMGWYQMDRLEAARSVGLVLKNIAGKGDYLLAWTTEPEIYVYSRLPLALVKTPLVNHLAFMPSEIESARLKFIEKPPKFIVLSDFDQTFPPPTWLVSGVKKNYMAVFSEKPYTVYKK